MFEVIKKNKNLILSSSICGINSNIYCGYNNFSGKDNNNSNNNPEKPKEEQNQNPPQNPPEETPEEDQDFEKKKNNLLQKINNLEIEYKKIVPKNEQKDELSDFREEVKSSSSGICDLEIKWAVNESTVKAIINKYKGLYRFIDLFKSNNIGKYLGYLKKEINYDFTLKESLFEESNPEELKDLEKIKKEINNYIAINNITNKTVIKIENYDLYYYFIINLDVFSKLDSNLKKNIYDYLEEEYIYGCKKEHILFEVDSKKLFLTELGVNIEQLEQTESFDKLNIDNIDFINKFFQTEKTKDNEKVDEINQKIEDNNGYIRCSIKKEADEKIIYYFFDKRTYDIMNITNDNSNYIKQLSVDKFCVCCSIKDNNVEYFQINNVEFNSYDPKTKTLVIECS